MKSGAEKRRFILDNTSLDAPPHVPEIRLHLADEAHDLWLKTEEELEAIGLPPPFWAFAWAGGQGLARYLLDHPEWIKGKRVLDLATGSGLVAIAALKAGAAKATGNDIDSLCETAVMLNTECNQVTVEFDGTDFLTKKVEAFDPWDVILAGDVFYDRAMAEKFETLLRKLATAGKSVLVGDPGRAYFPQTGMHQLADYQVPVTRMLEDNEVKRTRVWQVEACS